MCAAADAEVGAGCSNFQMNLGVARREYTNLYAYMYTGPPIHIISHIVI